MLRGKYGFWCKSFIALMALAGSAFAGAPLNTDHGLALHGYDPVSYFSGKPPQPGHSELTYHVDGATYRFVSAENLEIFKHDPKKYEPRYGGWCAYAMAKGERVDVDPKTFKIFDGKLLLFYNGFWGNTLEKWNRDEGALYPQAERSWEKEVRNE
jgi:YHS domain-containing protein